jgi:hypothetical protein
MIRLIPTEMLLRRRRRALIELDDLIEHGEIRLAQQAMAIARLTKLGQSATHIEALRRRTNEQLAWLRRRRQAVLGSRGEPQIQMDEPAARRAA